MTRLPSRAVDLMAGPARGVLLSLSRDPDGKVTFVTTSRSTSGEPLAVKVPTTTRAAASVEAEGRMLVALRRLPLGAVHDTIPRYVESIHEDGTTVLVSTRVTGTPMSVGYHCFLHTARPEPVRADFRRAGLWLRELQRQTAGAPAPFTWPSSVHDDVAGRWDGHPDLPAALARLAAADERLSGLTAPATAVHGDFWFGNVLVSGNDVTGVIDWECGSPSGSPARDLARFALSYCLYLDRHARPGRRVIGHPGLRRTTFGAGVRYGLLGDGWLPALVRDFLAGGLQAIGLPRSAWYDVALVGLGEIAATANDETFGAGHLTLLAGLPVHPRVERRQP